MMKPTAVIAIVVLLNLCQLHTATAAIKSLNQSYFYPNKDVTLKEYSLKEGTFVYAVCRESKAEQNCQIIQRQYPNGITRSCNVTLRPFHLGNDRVKYVTAHAFGRENAIIVWDERESAPAFNVMAIKMKSCEKMFISLNDPRYDITRKQNSVNKVLTYDDDFDLLVENMKSGAFKADDNQVGVRYRFDRQPQPIRDIIFKNNSEGESVRFISSIDSHSPDKGYVYSTKSGEIPYSLYLVKPDGTKKLLARRQERDDRKVFTSAAYGAITACLTSDIDSQTTCTHYDENGDFKYNVTLDHDERKSIKQQVLRNSPRGGFLLMTAAVEITDEPVHNYNSGINSYDVVRVDNEGKKVGSVRLNDFVGAHANVKGLWDNGDEYCAALIGQSIRQHYRADLSLVVDVWASDNVHVVVNCFTDSDFSA